MDIKGKSQSNALIVGDLITTHINVLSRHKINKEIMNLNITIHQVELIDIYRTFHPKRTEHIF